jgi:hypothetical protein
MPDSVDYVYKVFELYRCLDTDFVYICTGGCFTIIFFTINIGARMQGDEPEIQSAIKRRPASYDRID